MRGLGILALTVLLVAGCATPPGGQAGNPTPTVLEPSSVACPQVEGVELPPECIPYDPQALMDSNEAYKDRLPVSADAFAAFEAKRADITAAIGELQQTDGLSVDSVITIMEDNGVTGAQAGEADGVVTFGGDGPEGGCVFGTASATDIDMVVKGPVMDGGCVALSGH